MESEINKMQHIFFNEPWNESYEKQKTTPNSRNNSITDINLTTGSEQGTDVQDYIFFE